VWPVRVRSKHMSCQPGRRTIRRPMIPAIVCCPNGTRTMATHDWTLLNFSFRLSDCALLLGDFEVSLYSSRYFVMASSFYRWN
jgi:hypothetical protein